MRPLAPLLLALAACTASPEPSDWHPLFNGVDLSGWVPVTVAPDTFRAQDGLLVCTGKPTGVLRSDRMYENFVLELEWRHMVPGGNAGLFVWSDPLPAVGVPFTRSLEVQVMDGVETADCTSDGDIFSIWGARFVPDRPHPSGWERCLPSEHRARPSPEWNHYRVTCRDGVIELEVNGAKVSGGRQATPRKGYVCLESEGSEVHFRNVRILELPDSEPALAAEDVAHEAGGDAPLYTGIDLSGWVAEGDADGTHWQARDSVLWTDGGGGELLGPALPSDFVLRLDWKREVEAPPRLPLVLPVVSEVPRASAPGWHRLLVTCHDGALTIQVDDEEPFQELCSGLSRPADPVLALRLAPGGLETEYANLFLRTR